MSKSRNTSTGLTAYSSIPDEWKSIHDIPQIEEMAKRLQDDPIFADQFFLQETNDPENYADGTYQPLVDYQGHLFDVLDQNDVIWLQGARGSAKSSTFARWLDSYCLRFSGVRAGLFAPSFRQSKQLHDYCTGYIAANSKIDAHVYKIESELAADPIRGQEVLMKFRNGSLIEALPAGDGTRLRGKRFNVIGIDEAYLLEQEFHVSHILPMGNVKIGNRKTKIIYMTTSYYADVYAYSILKGIAREVAAGTPGYAIVDVTLGDVIASGFPFDKKFVLHQLKEQTDETSGKLSDEAKMTFFNIWVKSGATFYTPSLVKDCQRVDLAVCEKRIEKDSAEYVLGVDPAGMGEDKTEMGVIRCPGNDDRQLVAVWKWQKQRPEEIAGNIHKMVDLYNIRTIVMDKSGSLGGIVADLCSKRLQLIDGLWQERTPIMLWNHLDVRDSRAQIVLTLPGDERILTAITGNRVDSTATSEIQLKNVLHLNMKQKMTNGKFFAPKMMRDEDYYNSDRGEIMDNIQEALGQFPKIDRKRTANGKDLYVDARGNWLFTRPQKDDGAYAIIYANYAANVHYQTLTRAPKSDVRFMWENDEEIEKIARENNHTIVLPKM